MNECDMAHATSSGRFDMATPGGAWHLGKSYLRADACHAPQARADDQVWDMKFDMQRSMQLHSLLLYSSLHVLFVSRDQSTCLRKLAAYHAVTHEGAESA